VPGSDVVAGELFRLARELRASSARIDRVEPGCGIASSFSRWADRLDAAARLRALPFRLVERGDELDGRLDERVDGDAVMR
jgi:hypothetical protein